MLCRNCGKTIPFAGNVCHWCKTSKLKDQYIHLGGVIGVVVGAGIGYLVGHIGYALVGAVAGWLLGAGAGLAIHDAKTKSP